MTARSSRTGLARRQAELLQQQCDHRQDEALGLLMAGKIEQALDVLEETFTLLMALLDFRPGDPTLEMRLGFLYKDLAQAFEAATVPAFRYVQSGLQLFEGLVERAGRARSQLKANGEGRPARRAGSTDAAFPAGRRLWWARRAASTPKMSASICLPRERPHHRPGS